MGLKSEITGQEAKSADRIEIEYFTDPLCCWSWAFEPHWRRFINENKNLIKWRYRMAGMLIDWKSYNDPLNDISNPAQMAPLWMQVKYSTHTKIDPDIWIEDPPQTSLIACIAVKCAEMQSAIAADVLLVCLREAVMVHKKNIARREVILELVKELVGKYSILDFDKFEIDFQNNRGSHLLKEDLDKTRLANIGRFPTITMQSPFRSKGLMVVGYRPYNVLTEAFKHITDELIHHQD